MNAGRPILLDRLPQKQELPEEVVRFQKMLMKVSGAQRDVVIQPIEGKEIEHKNADLVDTKDGTLLVYVDSENTIYRYPLTTIKFTKEVLKSQESKE